jgi:cyclopropane-fatty-acyl-phospholipid synthase
MLPTYFKTAFEVLRPGGLFLNHGISTVGPEPRRRGLSFGDVYVFPDGELVPMSHALRVAEETGFEVRDVESLREHYAETLRHWVRRLEAHESEAVAEVGEEKYRVWRLFMAASANGFASGRLNVYQTLLSKQCADGRCELPLTREDLYA